VSDNLILSTQAMLRMYWGYINTRVCSSIK